MTPANREKGPSRPDSPFEEEEMDAQHPVDSYSDYMAASNGTLAPGNFGAEAQARPVSTLDVGSNRNDAERPGEPSLVSVLPVPAQLADRLEPKHYTELSRDSAISDSQIERRGYRSIRNTAADKRWLREERLPFDKDLPQGWVCPYLDNRGTDVYWQYKPDYPARNGDKVIKYRFPVGIKKRLDFPPGYFENLAARPDAPIVLTEGIKKGDALNSRGVPAIVLPDVYGWRGAEIYLDEVQMDGRDVLLAFDADWATNANVREALIECGRKCFDYGAKSVNHIQFDDIMPEGKTGIDDWFAAGHTWEEALDYVRPLPLSLKTTDAALAAHFERQYTDRIKYSDLWGWLVYDGTHWRTSAERDALKAVYDLIDVVGAEIREEVDAQTRKDLKKVREHLEQSPKQKRVLEQAKVFNSIYLRPEDHAKFNAEPLLLPAMNGTLDLDVDAARLLRPASPEDKITMRIPVEYDPRAQCPQWLRFLNRIMDNDEAMVAFLQRAVGADLLGDSKYRAFFVAHGGGKNGKSTFLETKAALLGTFAATVQASTLMRNRNRNTISTDVARLQVRRTVHCSETAENEELDTARVKSMIGGDTFTARFLYREEFEFTPAFKIWLITNDRPVIRDTGDAIWDRVYDIPFTVRIPEDEIDLDLKAKLRTELPGILNWAIEGCHELQRHGLNPPERVLLETSDYRQASDPVLRFWTKHVVLDPQGALVSTEFCNRYGAWAMQMNLPVKNQAQLGRWLGKRQDIVKARNADPVRYDGARFKTPDEL